MSKCKIMAIVNEKGGVGKTTTATSLAYLLAKQGKKTALIDFDGQGHSSLICGVPNPNKLEVTIATLLNKVIMDEPLPPLENYVFRGENGIDLIPSNSQLFILERNLSNVDFREYKLKEYIDQIKDNYEYIIIDCMPQIGTPMVNVMMCSDSIIIPTQAEILSAMGLTELLKHYHAIRKNSNHTLIIEGILVTMYSPRTKLSASVMAMLEESYLNNIRIFNAKIPRSVKVGEANLYQQTICEYLPENPVSLAYEEFVKELIING